MFLFGSLLFKKRYILPSFCIECTTIGMQCKGVDIMNDYVKQAGGNELWSLLCEGEGSSELLVDCSLPDYQPEIKRLLRVEAIASLPQKYLSKQNLEVFGGVCFRVLYAGNDGALYSFEQNEEYRFGIPLELPEGARADEGFSVLAEVVPSAESGRVVAPRRLSLKCRLCGRARLWGALSAEARVEGGENATLERLMGSARAAQIFFGEGEPLTLGDEILCDEREGDLRVVLGEGRVFVDEATAGSGEIECRGEVILKLLCVREDSGEVQTVQRRIPFTQRIAADGVEVNCSACAVGRVGECKVSVEEGRILCDCTLHLLARAERNCEVSYTKDLYAVGRVSQNEYCERRLFLSTRCKNLNFSVNSTLSLEEAGVRPTQSVIDSCALPVSVTAQVERGRMILSGVCRVQLLLLEDGEYIVRELEAPFRYETDGSALPGEEAYCDALAEAITCRARMDGERIAVDAELGVSLCGRAEQRITLLETAMLQEALPPDFALTVCYPRAEDTLWSVAKRYAAPVSRISDQNGLSNSPVADSPDSLSGVRFLLI